ncbi:MAG: hypothetical protein WBW44_06520 [Solirubrobacterales bacterium]
MREGNEDKGMDPAPSWQAQLRERLPLILLAVLTLVSGFLILRLTASISFVSDEWDLLLLRQGWGIDQFMAPFHEHTVIAPAFVYHLIQEVFGMDSARPNQLLATGTFLLSCVLFFLYVRRRVGPWMALIMTALILFLGAAFEDLLWAFQFGYFGSLAAGLGALIALDRDDRTGDVVASVLLFSSLLFSSLGIPFVAAAVVEWLINPRNRLRRLFVPGAAIAFYAFWWLGWGHSAESELSLANIPDLPSYLFTAISAGFTSIAGLATGDGSEAEQPHLVWGRIIFVVGLAAAVWHLRKRGSVPAGLWVVGAAGLSFYLLAGLNMSDLRPPESSRYQLPSAIFILLVAAWVLDGVRFRAPVLAVSALLSCLAIVSGLQLMDEQAKARWQPTSTALLNSLGAVDIAGEAARPGYTVLVGLKEPVPMQVYLDATRDFGSPGTSEEELAESDSATRAAADSTLINALGIEPSGREPLRHLKCQRLLPGETYETFGRNPDVFNRGDEDLGIGLSRFSDAPGLEVGAVLPKQSAGLILPDDESDRPWRIAITRGGPATVCG